MKITVTSFILLFLSCSFIEITDADLNRYTNNITTPKREDGWLILVYISGTGTLEEESIEDIKAIEDGYLKSNHREDIDIVILHDRGPGYSTSDGDWTGTYLYETDENGLQAVTSAENWRLTIDQEESMGSAETLDSFLSWAHMNFNRESEALIIWNHGGGLSGQTEPKTRAVSWDTEDMGDGKDEALFIDEIQQVLKTHYSSRNRLKLLGFDACFMGMTEIIYEFRGLVEFIVASPSAETGGWRYKDVLSTLRRETTVAELSESIIHTYYDFSLDLNLENTLSSFDLSYIEEVKEELNRLMTSVSSVDKGDILTLRESSLTYYRSEINSDSILYPYIDLGYFLDQLETISELDTTSLKRSLSLLISHSFNLFHTVDTEPYYGVSIFFPEHPNDYPYQWWYTSEDTGSFGSIDFCSDSSWKELMDRLFLE